MPVGRGGAAGKGIIPGMAPEGNMPGCMAPGENMPGGGKAPGGGNMAPGGKPPWNGGGIGLPG